jgi:hypothetical protein
MNKNTALPGSFISFHFVDLLSIISVTLPIVAIQYISESTKIPFLFLIFALKATLIVSAIFSYNSEFYTEGDTHCIGYFPTVKTSEFFVLKATLNISTIQNSS